MRACVAAFAWCLLAGALATEPARQLEMAREAEDTASRIELLRRLLDTQPGDGALREELARAWVEAGDPGMAAATLDGWAEAPADLAAIVRAAAAPDREAALAILQEALPDNPDSAELIEETAGALMASGQPGEAARLLGASGLTRDDADLLVLLASARAADGDLAGAQSAFKDARRVDPEGTAGRAAAFERLEAARLAIAACDRVLAGSPGNLAAMMRRSALWHSIGDRARAEADAQAARKAHPGAVSARLAVEFARGRNEDPAIVTSVAITPEQAAELAALDEAVARNRPGAALRRAAWLNTAGQHALALEDAAGSTQPGLERVRAFAGLRAKREAPAAAVAVEQSGAGKATAAGAWLLVAQMQLASGDIPLAAASANRAISLAPTAAAYRLRAQARSQAGDNDGAAEDRAQAAKMEGRR